MKTLLLLAVIMSMGLLQAQGNLLNFRKMIEIVVGKEAVLSYAFYGCYCGWGGKGSPKDATDWCCFEHDCCYAELEDYGCGTKFLGYKFSSYGDTIVCGKKDGDFCRRKLCQCDRNAAYCFARNEDTYDENVQYYSNQRCSGRTPQC
ncbi:PREDICTED: phospholipase A2, membrane associated-like [Elephantulus edwardii]|uniref:phospholipase A2, membrane associated-like n=1 Tax=Elephantulus edwardii TaxID=28737 RepID=UPI0003F098A6|nr:PREDICTED: phospholipase A2, membrane associated-like [Elephantulus edwardii]